MQFSQFLSHQNHPACDVAHCLRNAFDAHCIKCEEPHIFQTTWRPLYQDIYCQSSFQVRIRQDIKHTEQHSRVNFQASQWIVHPWAAGYFNDPHDKFPAGIPSPWLPASLDSRLFCGASCSNVFSSRQLQWHLYSNHGPDNANLRRVHFKRCYHLSNQRFHFNHSPTDFNSLRSTCILYL